MGSDLGDAACVSEESAFEKWAHTSQRLGFPLGSVA